MKRAKHALLPKLAGLSAPGVGLLSFDPHVHPPLAAFPLATLSPADLDSPRAAPSSGAASDFRGCEYAFATDSQLWHVAYRCLPQGLRTFTLLWPQCLLCVLLWRASGEASRFPIYLVASTPLPPDELKI